MRLIAVDWSGAQSGLEQRRRIAVADWQAGAITLMMGRTREEVTAWLIEQAKQTRELFVGLDFSFSFPAWFVRQSGAASVDAFWEYAALHAERWLAGCNPPFWGRTGRRCPPDHRGPDWRGYRDCERRPGIGHPTSTFQVGGAGAVGTGSLRGIPTLIALRSAGSCIWPFHGMSLPCAVEIYPRSFTGPVNKSSREARTDYLEKYLECSVSSDVLESARSSEDAFDALCSVIGMARQQDDFTRLKRAADATHLLEGDIFPGQPLSTY